MSFVLTVPKSDNQKLEITLNIGEQLFVLGANGSGKSSIMHKFYAVYRTNASRISAHRQTWFSSNSITLSPEQKRNTETSIKDSDAGPESRYMDRHSTHRAGIAIYDLIDAENVRARSIAGAVDVDNLSLAKELSKKEAPIKIINELLRISNIPVEISVLKNEQVVASKQGCEPYSIAKLSDGERNAILIAAQVLTIKSGTLVLVDEPERHLHRSIISPLLTNLFEKRNDCAFVISTHDVMLPIDNPDSRTLLIRDCTYVGDNVTEWDADIVESTGSIDDEIRADILGARRKILFIEGEEHSLDKSLYSIIFPGVSIIDKSSCGDVEHAVTGIRGSEELHWVHAFGVVDNDRRTPDDIAKIKEKGIYAVSVFSVESIYYHPHIQRCIADRTQQLTGDDPAVSLDNAKNIVLRSIEPHVQRLSERVVEKLIRERVTKQLPGQSDISSGVPVNISIDVATIIVEERDILMQYLQDENIVKLISNYPVRETPALTEISKKLGFQNRKKYEAAVRKLLMDDDEALSFVRSMFGTLEHDM